VITQPMIDRLIDEVPPRTFDRFRDISLDQDR